MQCDEKCAVIERGKLPGPLTSFIGGKEALVAAEVLPEIRKKVINFLLRGNNCYSVICLSVVQNISSDAHNGGLPEYAHIF